VIQLPEDFVSSSQPISDPFVESVFFPSDFSEASETAFAHALAIALIRQTDLVLLHVGQKGQADADWAKFPAVRKTLERWQVLEPGSPRSAVLDQFNVRVQKVRLRGSDPAEAVSKYLADKRPDVIVLATEGRDGLPRWLKSSVAERIARDSGCMTLFVPAGSGGFVDFESGQTTLRRILIPIDHSPDPSAALEYAKRLGEAIGDRQVEIMTLHVGENAPAIHPPHSERCAWSHQSRTGDPVEVIIDAVAEMKPDLVVMATEGRQGILEAFSGSTSEQILRSVSVPLLAVPGLPTSSEANE
jgi:nucleotide-binding universal stress UspA family protein